MEELFNTQMDFVISNGDKKLILDAKWKEININDERLGVSQNDLYQLFTYSEIIRHNKTKNVSIALLYPQTTQFNEIKKEWSYFNGTKIYLIPVNVIDIEDNSQLLDFVREVLCY